MSCCTTPVTNSTDPSKTKGLRTEFLKAVRRRFRRLRGAIRELVGYETDIFRLAEDAAHVKGRIANAESDEPFEYETEREAIQGFIRWLKDKIREEVLEPVTMSGVNSGAHWTAPYIRAAYERGWQQGAGRITAAGAELPHGRVEAVFDLPVPREQLRKLYTRTYENLESVSEDIAPQVRNTLTQGLAEGVNPREMARRLTNEVRSMQHSRAETLARSEVINSHSTATLDRYERAGVETVAHGEWRTAGDSRVCPVCESLDGRTFSIGEMRDGTFEFAADDDDVPDYLAGTYRLKPPSHPNGRCVVLPVIN